MSLGRHAVATDPGRKRRHNEDAYVVEPPLFAVADGMGGAQAGEVASKLAAGALREGGSRALEDLIQEANRRVHQRSIEDPGAAGMGTTMTVAMVEDGSVRFGHVGDSRAYLVRGGRLEQLTQDHSLVGELVRSGQLAQEDAESHPQRSVITRAVGTDPDVDVDTFAVDAQEGDVFLLCSDGLTDMVADDRIEQLVEEQRDDLDRLVKALVRAANKGGGDDNITVIAFEIGSAGARATDDEATMVVRRPEEGDPDDEDTLTEEDGVPTIPTVDTMVVSADELAAAYDAERAAAPPRRRRRSDALLLLLVLLVFAALVLLALWGLYR